MNSGTMYQYVPECKMHSARRAARAVGARAYSTLYSIVCTAYACVSRRAFGRPAIHASPWPSAGTYMYTYGCTSTPAGHDANDATPTPPRGVAAIAVDGELEKDRAAANQLDDFFWHFDMLCDGERNAFFDEALQHVITRMHRQGIRAHVLDIGTGSGLLALLAKRHRADAITAIECVPKLADIAASHFKKQAATVCLLKGSSRDLTTWPSSRDGSVDVVVASGQLHSSRPNVVVAEVLETGLLGEGVLPTLRHAAAHLLAPGFTAIPAVTKVYARLVSGVTLRNSETVPDRPEYGPGACSGVVAPWHVHTEAMRQQGLISYVTDAFEVLSFDWAGDLPGPEGRSATKCVTLSSAGSVDGILMYWTCMASRELEAELSTAPNQNYQRDHWRQAIYTRCANSPRVREQLAAGLEQGARLEVTAHHDDHEIWFDIVGVSPASQSKEVDDAENVSRGMTSFATAALPAVIRPLCTCGAHTTLSRHACLARNDVLRQARLQLAGCKPGDADCGDGPLAQMRWFCHISAQKMRAPCRVDLYAQAIRCPAVTRQFECTNGQPPFRRRRHDKYLARVPEMDLLRATQLGVVVPRTVALWEFPHELLSAPVLVVSTQQKDFVNTPESNVVLTSGQLEFGIGSSKADAVALWCDLVYERLGDEDKEQIVLVGGAAGGLHQMCDVVPIAWNDHEAAPDGNGQLNVRIRLDWSNNLAQCAEVASSSAPNLACPTLAGGTRDTMAPTECTHRRKTPRHR